MDTQSPTYSDDELTAALAGHLASLERDDSYRVDRVLKHSDVETTELVYFEGSGGGSLGPFVRKRIDASAQIGGAYERLFAAQHAGRRYEHLPRIVDYRRVGDELCVVMEYIEGETLGALVGRLGATPDYACELFGALCDAVAELHAGFASAGEMAAPVIHRDLKPSNIIVSGANYTLDTGMTFSSNMREQCEAYDIPASLADVICMAMALDPDKRFASAKALGHAARASYALSAPTPSSAPNAASFQEPPERRAVCPAPVLPTDQSQGGLPLVPERPNLLSCIPDTVGRIWNAFVYLSLLVFFAGSHFAVFHPTGANQNYPMWFLAIEYFIFVDGLVVLIHFVMLDKRRLRRRFELLDRYHGKKLAKLWLKAMGVLLLAMIIIVAIANATGVVDTSVA